MLYYLSWHTGNMGRNQSTSQSINTIRNITGKTLTHVIDIGVQYKTGYLIDSCSDLKHILVEPCSIHQSAILNNYDSNDHQLFHGAATGKDKLVYLHDIANDPARPDHVTHSYISTDRISPNPRHVKTTEIQALSIDSIFNLADLDLAPDSCILKIDVDGIEEEIMRGIDNSLPKIGVLIVESTLESLCTKISIASSHKLQLLDITDHGYYYDILTQVELVFVSSSLKKKYVFLDPWKATNGVLHPGKWQHV